MRIIAIAVSFFIAMLPAVGSCNAAVGSGIPVIIDRMPHLGFDERDSHFLGYQEAWKPSRSTLITALAANQTLQIYLDLQHVTSHPPCKLMFKCSSSDVVFQNVSLSPDAIGQSVTLCEKIRPFSIFSHPDSKVSNWYNLTLSQKNSIDFFQAMVHVLELRINVQFSEGTAESGSLFIHNLDALAKLNEQPVSVHGIPFTKYILSDEAIQFFINLTSPQNGSVRQIQLLDKRFMQALRNASDLIRTILYVSVLIRGNKQCTDKLMADSTDILFTSGDSHEAFTSILSTKLTSFIHIGKGILIYSEYILAKQRAKLATTYVGKPIRVCLRISLNTPVWDYHLSLTVAELNPQYFLQTVAVASSACRSVDNRKKTWKILTEGMRDVLLLSPIVCTEISAGVFTVFYNNKECVNLILGSNLPWQDCNGYFISNHGNAIWLKVVEQRHAGNYRFVVSNVIFDYYVTILFLPKFNTVTKKGSLPHTTYANLDLQVSFNCTVHHYGMKYISLTPIFQVLDRVTRSKWVEYGIDEFALKVLNKAPNSISQHRPGRSGTFTNLQVVMPHVDLNWRTWILIYTCRAATYDAKIMGVPYLVETSTDVVYFGKRHTYELASTASNATHRLLLLLLSLVWFLLQRH